MTLCNIPSDREIRISVHSSGLFSVKVKFGFYVGLLDTLWVHRETSLHYKTLSGLWLLHHYPFLSFSAIFLLGHAYKIIHVYFWAGPRVRFSLCCCVSLQDFCVLRRFLSMQFFQENSRRRAFYVRFCYSTQTLNGTGQITVFVLHTCLGKRQ